MRQSLQYFTAEKKAQYLIGNAFLSHWQLGHVTNREEGREMRACNLE